MVEGFVRNEGRTGVDDELRAEYDLSRLGGRVRGKYVERYRKGDQASIIVLETDPDQAGQPHAVELAYPTHLVAARKLDSLTDLLAMGGDALADSEALYE